jgi:hypothetical protein
MAIADEIAPGLVLHLDPVALEHAGGSTSVLDALKVKAPHFFVCLSYVDGQWRLMPCYTANGVGRFPISESDKGGHPKWASNTTYFHPQQVWVAPLAAIEEAAAAGGDRTRPGRRNWVNLEGVKDIP